MTHSIRFDDSLPAFAALVAQEWGARFLAENLFLRDASGRLTFVVLGELPSLEAPTTLAARAAAELGGYVDGGGFAVATPDQLFDDRLRDLSDSTKLEVGFGKFKGWVNLVDRRMVGADWLRSPTPASGRPARFVFGSVKGGVGRSTALCVVASALAIKGRRVLAIDMDLEAPGLGNFLLPGDTLPEFGLLDFLVEMEIGSPLDEKFYADLLGHSPLVGGAGRLDVIPAIGSRSLRHPANVLGKLARAYLSGSGPIGQTLTFSDRLRTFVERFADPRDYDCILVDARAGLHETTAAAVLGLGAEVLLFGLDQPQTFAGYELLFAHLGTLQGNTDDEWPSRLHIVQAKAPPDPKLRGNFAERMDSLRAKYFSRPRLTSEANLDPSSLKDTFDVEWTEGGSGVAELLDEADRPTTMSIFDDDRFRSFDPVADRSILTTRASSVAFDELIEMVRASADAPDGSERK